MIILHTQTDPQWRDTEMTKGITIGQYGCLLVSLSNCVRQSSIGYREHMNPAALNTILQNNGGFTPQGLIIWSVLEKFFFCQHTNIMKRKPIFASNIHNIIQIPYMDTGHFCNLLDVSDHGYIYFDVYDGIEKTIDKSRIVSTRQIIFHSSKGEK